jgi:two-component system NtrC family response regulator
MNTGLILVVDDEKAQRENLAEFLTGQGHEVLQADAAEAALALVGGRPVDLILTDLRMPGASGVDLLKQSRTVRPDIAVVVMTAFGTIDTAVEAMRHGASDFLTKPIDLDQLELVIARALKMRTLERENLRLRRRLEEATGSSRLVGASGSLGQVLSRAERAAATDATVLILGESGTGKELLARSIHDLSARADGPFVAVNCAALPENLLESELFGHTRGAFTGADSDRLGRVQAAAKGTLFLDEIGDVPLSVQVKLLRFLQDHTFQPVGSDKTWRADVRVVTATHRDLVGRVKSEEFREDLYFRLNVVNLELPPLRERREDIPALTAHFLEKYAGRYQRKVRAFSADAMAALMSHDYPGNVRELENIVEQSVVMALDDVVHQADLPGYLGGAAAAGGPLMVSPDQVNGDLPGLLEALEKRIVHDTLARFEGNQSSAARHLGLTESGLRYKLGKWREG